MPLPPVPQTGRTPADFNDSSLRTALRQRHHDDDRDIFAVDPDSEIRQLGRIALRRAGTSAAIDDLLALGDLCAQRTRTDDGRLRVFYAGKALIAYRRAIGMAEIRGLRADGQEGRRAADAFIAWLVAAAEANPTRRNIAVALWAVGEYDDLAGQSGGFGVLPAGTPPNGNSASIYDTDVDGNGEFYVRNDADNGTLIDGNMGSPSHHHFSANGDTLSDIDATNYSDLSSAWTLDASGELRRRDPNPPASDQTPPTGFSSHSDEYARGYLQNRTLDEVVLGLLEQYANMSKVEPPADEAWNDNPTPSDASPATYTTSMLFDQIEPPSTPTETQTWEMPRTPPPERPNRKPKRPSKTAPDSESVDFNGDQADGESIIDIPPQIEPSATATLEMTSVAPLPNVYESNVDDLPLSDETRHEIGVPDWMPSLDSAVAFPELADELGIEDTPRPFDDSRVDIRRGAAPELLLNEERRQARLAPDYNADDPAQSRNAARVDSQHDGISEDQSDEFNVGSLIDHRYEVVSVKRGGMGVVYLCYDHQRREPVAIKSFQSRFFNNDRARARFNQEAWTWIRLEKHRHIVQARLVQTIDGRPHLILEHISGPEGVDADLRSWIERKRLTLPLSLKFGLHIALGMQHAAQKVPGLVHRDLKPANILVTHDEVAKVTDFGLVRSVEDTDSMPPLTNGFSSSSASSPTGEDTRAPSTAPISGDERLTKFGALVGTLPYMSPEQCQARDVDQRADIYAFGCLLYEMLTGTHIFNVRKRDAWLSAHIHERPVFPAAFAAALPRALQALVLTCLEKQPDARPASWSVVVDALGAIYEDVTGESAIMDVSGIELEARELMDKAYSLTELGRADEALVAYERAIELQPTNAWAWARKARALRLLNRYHEALATYDEALRLDPKYAWALKGKGIVLERLGDLDGALDAHRRAAQLDPDDVWHWHNQGDIYQKMGRYQEALAMLEEALKVDPQHANTWAKLGQVLRLMRQMDQAVAAYRRALEIDPKYAWAHNGLGLTLKAIGEYKSALDSFRLATRYDPRVVWHWYNVTEMLVELKEYKEALHSAKEAVRISPDHVSAQGKLGQVLRYLKQYDEALKAYDRAIRLQPNFAWAHNGKGIIYEQMGRYQEALECYRLATQYGSLDASHWYNQGNALALLGRMEEAIPMLERALEIKPDFGRAWARLGGTLRQLGRLTEAVDALRNATQLDPTNAWAWSEMGRALESLKRFDDAAQAQRRAAESKPDHAIYLTQHADALFSRGEFSEAFDVLEQAIRLDPRNPRAWARRGQVLRRLGRHADALRSYERALEYDANYAWAWAGLAMAELSLNMIDEALRSFRQAIDLDPNDVWYRYTLGDTLVTLNRFQEAADTLSAATRIDPGHADIWAKLGQAYRRLRRHADALQAYDKAVMLKPDHAWAWNGRGLSLEALNQREEAIYSYRKALELDRSVIWYYTNLVDLLLGQRKHEDALELMDMALHELPDNPIAWARHGQVLRRMGAYDGALFSYQRALELDPTYAWAWNGIGLAHAALGQWQNALECYRESVKHNPNDAWFWYNFGDALMVMGDLKSAAAMFEKALAVDPKHEPSQKKLKQAREQLGE